MAAKGPSQGQYSIIITADTEEARAQLAGLADSARNTGARVAEIQAPAAGAAAGIDETADGTTRLNAGMVNAAASVGVVTQILRVAVDVIRTASDVVDETTQSWIDAALAEEKAAQATAKAALLNRLGITADEARLLLS